MIAFFGKKYLRKWNKIYFWETNVLKIEYDVFLEQNSFKNEFDNFWDKISLKFDYDSLSGKNP